MIGNEISSYKKFTSNIIRKTTYVRWARLGFLVLVLANILLMPVNLAPTLALADAATNGVNIWWPTDGSNVSGVQPFKAMVPGMDPSQYQMFWQVDGGALNPMSENDTDSPHMEASVDLSSWNWHGSGPYNVTFVAQKGGVTVAQSSVNLYVGGSSQAAPAPQPTSAATQTTQSQTTSPTPTDTDPAHIAQMQALVQAVQSGQDTDPVHIAQANAYLASIGQSQTSTSAPAQTQSQPAPTSASGTSQSQSTQMSQPATLQIASPTAQTSVSVAGLIPSSGDVNLTLKDGSGNTIATAQMQVGSTQSESQSQSQSGSGSQFQSQSQSQSVQIVNGVETPNASASTFYVDPNSEAATQEAQWQNSDPSDAAKMATLAAQSTAAWFGGWSGDIQSAVSNYVSAAAAANQIPVLVAYNIPDRDCGGDSSGGASSASAYTDWIGSFARGIGNAKAMVILEPDALAEISCLSSSDQATREQLLSSAVSILKSQPNTSVYIDAGHSGWVDPQTMASELQKANIATANGFSLNVSNFDATNVEATYGEQVSGLAGGKHFVIDTGRNGSGSNGQWCNPSGMTIGTKPTTNTGNSLIDAYLWVKVPGESDGNCNGGPAAGVWWAAYALSLVK